MDGKAAQWVQPVRGLNTLTLHIFLISFFFRATELHPACKTPPAPEGPALFRCVQQQTTQSQFGKWNHFSNFQKIQK